MLATKDLHNKLRGIIEQTTKLKKENKYAEGIEVAKEALRLASEIQDIKNKKIVLGLLADMTYISADYVDSMQYILKLIKYDEKSGDKISLGKHYNSLAVLYLEQDNYIEAEIWLKKAYKLVNQQKTSYLMTKILINQGYLRYKQYDYVAASNKYNEALQIAEEKNYFNQISLIKTYQGLICIEKKDFETAEQYMIFAFNLAEEIKEFNKFIQVGNELGKMYYNLKEYDKSFEITEKVYEIAKARSYKSKMRESLMLLANICSEKGNYKKSNEYLYSYIQINAEVINDEKQKQFTKMRVQFETVQKEKEAEIYRLKNEELTKKNEEIELLNSKLQERNEELHKISVTDHLTRSYNRYYIMDVFAQRFYEAINKNEKFSCILFDIDKFKDINDTNGHLFGDYVIKETAKEVENIIGKENVLGRFGGDEFIILLPYKEIEEGILIAEKVRKYLDEKIYKLGTLTHHVTLSMGITDNKYKLQRNAEEMLNYADRALYKAKEDGRNRVVSAYDLD